MLRKGDSPPPSRLDDLDPAGLLDDEELPLGAARRLVDVDGLVEAPDLLEVDAGVLARPGVAGPRGEDRGAQREDQRAERREASPGRADRRLLASEAT